MIGHPIQSRRSFPWGVLIFLLVGVALLVVAAAERNPHWAIGSALPLFIAFALAWSRPRSLTFEFTETGLEVLDSGQSIPYEAFETVIAVKRPGNPDKPGPRHYAIDVVHADGTLHIPPKLNVPSDDGFHFLLSTFPPGGTPQVNPALRPYLDEQLETFGADRVWSYRARSNPGNPAPSRAVAFCLGVVLAGLLWLIVGGVTQNTGWLGGGIFLAMMGGLFALLFWLVSSRGRRIPVKGWKNASLVISPVGLALVQGDLRGKMRWDELRDLKFTWGGGSFEANHNIGRGIQLKFEGAQVLIADVYDRPLNLIYKQIRGYWREPGRAPS